MRSPRASFDLRIERLAVVTLTGLWLLMIPLINPIGDFPLNDDWAYGQTVYHLVTSGSWSMERWFEPSLVAQALWGALFCLPFGFSFTALRLSTLVLGLIGLLSTYVLLRRATPSHLLAGLGVLLVALNPLYLSLSYTFMTDVPFYALATLAVVLFVWGIESDNGRLLVLGMLLSCLATLTRQIGIVIPFACAIAYLARYGLSARTIRRAVAWCAPVLLLLLAYQVLRDSTFGAAVNGPSRVSQTLLLFEDPLSGAGALIGRRSSAILVYVGLFLLPLLFVVGAGQWLHASRRARVGLLLTTGFLAAALVAGLVYTGHSMPILQNVLYDIGLGPASLRDALVLKTRSLPHAPPGAWTAITVVAGVAGAILLVFAIAVIVRVFERLRREHSLTGEWFTVLALAINLFYFMPLATGQVYFDRYVLLHLPLVMILIVGVIGPRITVPRWAAVAAAALIIPIAAFSIAATHDYLSWNRARWNALDDLVKVQGISPHAIDGGFEFNGWYLYDPNYKEKPGKSWWWVDGDEYIVAFGPIPAYSQIRSYPYDRWLPPGQGHVAVLKKRS